VRDVVVDFKAQQYHARAANPAHNQHQFVCVYPTAIFLIRIHIFYVLLRLLLLLQGWSVFAGARSESDLQQLAQLHAGITPVRLDVTS
jgi:hypothetical protein